MVLYLTSNIKSRLIDTAITDMELNAKKLIGKFSLRSFVAKDMRNYAAARYFVVDRSCVEDGIDDFIVALQSFQMMFAARIIVMLSGCENKEVYIERLCDISIYNIITADTQDELNDELIECLSENGIQKYVFTEQADEPERPDEEIDKQMEVISKYKWIAKNVRIAIAGSQHKCGVTVTAFNMAAWLKARGAKVCYVEHNENRHLQWIVSMYGSESDGDFYSVQGIDCYLVDEIKEDYNFIIYDCGNILDLLPQVFQKSDVRLLCGGLLPYEMPNLAKGLSKCNGFPLTIICLEVPEKVQNASQSIFDMEIQILKPSHDLFSENINGHVYMPIVKKWIV